MAGTIVVAPIAAVDSLIKLNIDSIAGDHLSPDISGLIGKVAKSAKGNFKVTAKNLSTTLVADKPERFIYQGLAMGVSTLKIEFVEIGVVEF